MNVLTENQIHALNKLTETEILALNKGMSEYIRSTSVSHVGDTLNEIYVQYTMMLVDNQDFILPGTTPNQLLVLSILANLFRGAANTSINPSTGGNN